MRALTPTTSASASAALAPWTADMTTFGGVATPRTGRSFLSGGLKTVGRRKTSEKSLSFSCRPIWDYRSSFESRYPGHLATLVPVVPRLLWEQETRGSSPHTPTTFRRKTTFSGDFLRFCSALGVWTIAVQRWFQGQKSVRSMGEDSRRNRQIPNPSLISATAVLSL